MAYDEISASEQEETPKDEVKEHSSKFLKKAVELKKKGKTASAKKGVNPFAKKAEKKSGKKFAAKK